MAGNRAVGDARVMRPTGVVRKKDRRRAARDIDKLYELVKQLHERLVLLEQVQAS